MWHFVTKAVSIRLYTYATCRTSGSPPLPLPLPLFPTPLRLRSRVARVLSTADNVSSTDMQPQWCNDSAGTFPAGSKPSSRCTEFECVYSYVYARDHFLEGQSYLPPPRLSLTCHRADLLLCWYTRRVISQLRGGGGGGGEWLSRRKTG